MLQFKHAVMNQCIFYCIQSNITFFSSNPKTRCKEMFPINLQSTKSLKKTMGFPLRWCLIVKLYMITDY